MDRTEFTHAWRALMRTPMFTIGVVVTLSLALAAGIAAITIVDRVLLRPLPLRDADAVASLMESDGRTGLRLASYPTFRDWVSRARGFEGLGFARGDGMSLGESGKRERATVALVSPGFLSVAGIAPLVGRTFSPEEEQANGGGVALISEAIWGAQFGRDPGAIGKQLLLNAQPVTVIGVVRAAQRFPEWAEVWMPIEPVAATSLPLQNRFLHVDSRTIGRLAPGTTLAAAARELGAIQADLSRQAPDPAGVFPEVQVSPLREAILGTSRGSVTALGVAMALVLLLACANVGGLVLLRMARRERAFAVRAALGAPFRVLVRQLVIESVMLATIAGAIGIGLASAVVGLIRATPTLGVPRAAELTIDARVVAIGLAVSLLVGLMIGLLPAWRLRKSVAAGVRFGRGAVTAGEGARALRAAVTALQLGLALTLLVGAGLMLRSFGRMREVDLGYQPEQTYAFVINPPSPRYDDEDAARSLYGRLVDRVAAVPGVRGAAFVNHVPLGGSVATNMLVPGVAPDPNGGDVALYKTASDTYADVMGLRVVRGRWFTRAEVEARSIGIVVSEAVARRFWPDADPIGRSITVYRASQARLHFGEAEPSTVVGVVAPVRHFGPANPPPSEVYLPYTREAWGWGHIVVRSSEPASVIRRSVEQALVDVEPDLPLSGSSGNGFRPMTAGVEDFMAPRKMSAGLAGGLAVVALLVASLGLYALAAYSVSQRTGEFGVRMALGATPGQIVQRVLLDGGKLAMAGVLAGALGATWLGKVLANQLFETSPADPVAIALAAAALLLVLLVALWVPARRAAKLDPALALYRE